ncbi:MAG: hypothetical protein HPAVJP_3250 [Candidatus Hepatoplasma vulgare]|nr:MAG: hypothetical protein HPAVJP_3250 [Candidatus Hepatoplasma sp.]
MKKYFLLILITPILFTTGLKQGIKNNSIDFKNLEATSNPYLKDDGTAVEIIDEQATDTTAQFELWVSDNENNDFYYNSLVANDDEIEITIIDETDSDNSIDTTAICTSDVGAPLAYYMFEIDNLETSHTYELYSLNNTGLAVGSASDELDDEIILADDLNITDNKFTPGGDPITNDNPYIEDGGFEITETAISSVQFQITVTNNEAEDFDETKSLDVTINDSEEDSHNTTATYVSTSGSNKYTYEMTELDDSSNTAFTSGESYEIYSLNDTGLAVISGDSEIDNEILINEDLGVDASFTATDENSGDTELPYIVTPNGFEIVETTTSSVQFQINVINNDDNDFNERNSIAVTIKDSHGGSYDSTASYVSTGDQNDTYIYEITELDDENGIAFTADESYEIYSLNDTGLAVGSSDSEIDNEILVNAELGVNGSFTTIDENDSDGGNGIGEWWLLAFIIFLIIMVTLGIFLLLQILDDRRWKKDFEEIEEEIHNSSNHQSSNH